MRQIFGDIGWEKKLVAFFSLIVIFVVVGPFGTYGAMSIAERFVYWATLMVGIAFFMHIAISICLQTTALGALPQALRIAVGPALAAVPSAAIIEFADEVFRPSGITTLSLLKTWFQVTLVGIIVGLLEYIDWRQNTAPTDAPKITTPFHARLSDGAKAEIISLSMQDHYVNVTTSKGSELILMRFSDALAEIEGLPGQRIHRSHWVAASHLVGLRKSGNRIFADLSDTRQLPVSGTYLDQTERLLA